MNNVIISNWNNYIYPTDEVFIVGNLGNPNYLNSIYGKKTWILSDEDKKNSYIPYVESISVNRNEKYDEEMFREYCKDRYNLTDVIFKKDMYCKLYIGKYVRCTVDYESLDSLRNFTLVGNMGGYQRLFKHGLNLDIYVNGMNPVSESEVADFMTQGVESLYY